MCESTEKDLLGYGSTADGQREFPRYVSSLGVVQGASTVRLILHLANMFAEQHWHSC